jgi:hypothetical protein
VLTVVAVLGWLSAPVLWWAGVFSWRFASFVAVTIMLVAFRLAGFVRGPRDPAEAETS